MIIRQPHADEVEAILALFARDVAAGLMLPRPADEMRQQLDRWLVAEQGGQMVGCVSLVYYNGTLAEVRSLAVHPDHRGNGVASQLVTAVVAMARARGLRRVLTLTRAAHLFERLGFERDAVSNFPIKVWQDCAPCPFKEHCDEIALVYELE
ncbi:MAG: GNAT family N-acetyltransferase [Anaerolineae bacterium]|nr:GNAT family N-acetyltransferase [Anaerolineae bacterium]